MKLLIYIIGAVINFIVTYIFCIKKEKHSVDMSDNWAEVILFTIAWPIMDLLYIAFLIAGYIIIFCEVLNDLTKKDNKN